MGPRSEASSQCSCEGVVPDLCVACGRGGRHPVLRVSAGGVSEQTASGVRRQAEQAKMAVHVRVVGVNI
eukprot:6258776-Prorocentrum_lima.AAC.1